MDGQGCHIPKLLKFAAGKSCVQICIAFVHNLPVSFICWDCPNGKDSFEFMSGGLSLNLWCGPWYW
jgi:hypothetical protein